MRGALSLQKEESDSPFFDSAVKSSARSQNEDEGLAHEEEDYIEGVDISVPVSRRTATPFIPPSQDLKTSSNSEDTSSTEELDDFCYSELNREEVLEAERQELLELIEGALSPAKLRLEGCPRFHFGIQEYTTEDLSIAEHSTDLESLPRPFLSLNLDPHLMGVGGDDSWTASVHDEHTLHPDSYSFEFSFSFLNA